MPQFRTVAAALALSLPAAAAQTALQQARVEAAQATASVRLLERTGQLRPAPVDAGCTEQGRARLTLLRDARGVTRVVRFDQLRSDNTIRFTAYADEQGRIRYATGRATGYPGELYNLSAEYDAQGQRLFESGKRRSGWASDLLRMPGLNLAGLIKGLCPR